jgi:hypothetical protein
MISNFYPLLLFVVIFNLSNGALDHIRTRTDSKVQEEEVKNLLQRIIPKQSQLFEINIQPDISETFDKARIVINNKCDQQYNFIYGKASPKINLKLTFF